MALTLSRSINEHLRSSIVPIRIRPTFVFEFVNLFTCYHSATQKLIVDDADVRYSKYDAEVLYSGLIDKSNCVNHLMQIHARLDVLGFRGNGFFLLPSFSMRAQM